MTRTLRCLLATFWLLTASLCWGSTEFALHRFSTGVMNDGKEPTSTLMRDSLGNFYGTTCCGGTNGDGTVFELSPPFSGTVWTYSILHQFSNSDGIFPDSPLLLDSSGNLYGTAANGGANNGGTIFELTPVGSAWTFSVLYSFCPGHNFCNGSSDGNEPTDRLAMDASGSIYGTTEFGGAHGEGTVWKASLIGGTWTENVLVSWSDANTLPTGVILDSTGSYLYGANAGSGNTSCIGWFFGGCGAVWRLRLSDSTPSFPYYFKGVANLDGSTPRGDLIFDSSGNLYGTTLTGGTGSCVDSNGKTIGCGTVFRLSPTSPTGTSWTETVLYNFTGNSIGDGRFPTSELVIDSSGDLYGTTSSYLYPLGSYGNGAVFKLTPPSPPTGTWSESTLHAFQGGNDGSRPPAGLVLDSGRLYGVTLLGGSTTACTGQGCGTVFEVIP